MCDTLVALSSRTSDGAVWFAKNSDREPGEAQSIEVVAASEHRPGEPLCCTYLEIPQVARTHAVVMSRPQSMWGCEMGVNEHGVAIGNEAVFTRCPVHQTGLTGMDLVRLALERGESATDAMEVITDLLGRYPQGGSGGYRNGNFYYHNSFLIADAKSAWVLESADRWWAAEQVRGTRSISNVLTIGRDADRLSAGAAEHAAARGWTRRGEPFDFARAFGSALFRPLTGGDVRRECTHRVLDRGEVDGDALREALRDHGATGPVGGWRSDAPCAHASWWPTRHAAQTTGSMIARITPDGPQVWATGTSSPCLSLFKPIPFEPDFDFGPTAAHRESLWWTHERYHRYVLRDYERLAPLAAPRISALELEVWPAAPDPGHWKRHRELADEAAKQAKHEAPRIPRTPSHMYWRWQQLRDR